MATNLFDVTKMPSVPPKTAWNFAGAPHFTNPRATYGFRRRNCSIAAVGCCVPHRILTTAELARELAVTEDWILSRTGIRERRIAGDEEHTSVMAVWAAVRALGKAGLGAKDIDLIVVATSTSDMPFPATACLVQAQIGAARAVAFDLQAGASGFLYALEVGQQLVASHTYDTVLVIGADKFSTIVDWHDRETSIVFGDGAGAVVLRSNPHSRGLLTTCLGSNGELAGLMALPGGRSQYPANMQSVVAGLHFLHVDGQRSFRPAVKAMHGAALEVLRRCELNLSQIKCIIAHQASRPILDALGKRLGASPGQMFSNVEKYGNTSAASVPIALNEVVESGRVQRGDLVLLVAFGAGLTWGAAILEW